MYIKCPKEMCGTEARFQYDWYLLVDTGEINLYSLTFQVLMNYLYALAHDFFFILLSYHFSDFVVYI